MITLIPAVREDLEDFLPEIRKSDIDENREISGIPMLESLELSLEHSVQPLFLYYGRERLALLGIARVDQVGIPWLVGTNAISGHPVAFARATRSITSRWKSHFQSMRNLVGSDNTEAVEWLEWLGFTVDAADPGVPYRQFHWSADLVH